MLQTDHLHWKDLLLEKSFSKDSQRFRNPQESHVFPGMVVRVLPKKKKKKNVINGLRGLTTSPFANHNGFGVQAFDFAKEYFMAFKQPEAVWFLDVCVSVGRNREGSNPPVRTQVPNPNVFEASVLLTAIFFLPGCQKQPSQKYHRKKYQQQLIQQTSDNLRIRTNQQNPYHLKP